MAAHKTHVEGEALAFLARHRSVAQVSVDALAWTVALSLALVGRYDLALPPGQLAGFVVFLPTALAVHIVVGLLFGLYQGCWLGFVSGEQMQEWSR